MKHGDGMLRFLHLLKKEGPLLTSQVSAKLNCSGSSVPTWARKSGGKVICKKILAPLTNGKMIKQFRWSLKDPNIDLPPLPNDTLHNEGTKGDIKSTVPEIQKIKQRLLHLVDQVQAIESMVVTEKERRILNHINEKGIQFKI